ncbi:retropepsin-like aspartic protease [Brytella acorum]|uniref:Retropepsin-like aspartic protease n=1 Tax=Brytella acorum TaxID=2959299 RepID=A0AA35UZI7_9PROT|nr:retropepsin-like aspartic protease [Brytella acorum]MDF3623627.1 retropepsin-like aspartic protease [Brytella acorum]CAI9119955.1 retropepsin-like aspartic protease [Brytella acorum]
MHQGITTITTPPATTTAKEKGPPPFVPEPYPFDIEAETHLPARCLEHILASEIISRNGSPTVPITINGERGGAFLSLSQDVIGVFDGNDERLDLPDIENAQATSLMGLGHSWTTRLDSFTFAQGHAEKVDALKMGEFNDPPDARMGTLGIMGFNILGNYNVLIDMPARRFVMFINRRTTDCPSLSQVIGARAFRAPLIVGPRYENNMVTVTVDGAPLGMYIEPGSNLSVVAQKDATADGLSLDSLHNENRVNTLAGETRIGYRHQYKTVSIGNWHGGPFAVNIEPVDFSLLGRDFFRHRRVLLGFQSGMMFFSDTEQDSGPRDIGGGNLSPISSHIAHTNVGQ